MKKNSAKKFFSLLNIQILLGALTNSEGLNSEVGFQNQLQENIQAGTNFSLLSRIRWIEFLIQGYIKVNLEPICLGIHFVSPLLFFFSPVASGLVHFLIFIQRESKNIQFSFKFLFTLSTIPCEINFHANNSGNFNPQVSLVFFTHPVQVYQNLELISWAYPSSTKLRLVKLSHFRSCLTEQIFRKGSRQFGHFSKYPNYGTAFSNSYFPYFPKKWNNLPRKVQNQELTDLG